MDFKIDDVENWYGKPADGETTNEVDFNTARNDWMHIYYTCPVSSTQDIETVLSMMKFSGITVPGTTEREMDDYMGSLKTQVLAQPPTTKHLKLSLVRRVNYGE